MEQAGLTNIFVIQVISVHDGQRKPIIYTKQLSFVAYSVQLPFFQFALICICIHFCLHETAKQHVSGIKDESAAKKALPLPTRRTS